MLSGRASVNSNLRQTAWGIEWATGGWAAIMGCWWGGVGDGVIGETILWGCWDLESWAAVWGDTGWVFMGCTALWGGWFGFNVGAIVWGAICLFDGWIFWGCGIVMPAWGALVVFWGGGVGLNNHACMPTRLWSIILDENKRVSSHKP